MNAELPRPRYSSRFVSELPVDEVEGPALRQVFGACSSRVNPTPVRAPRLVAHSREVAALLGFDDDFVRSQRFSDVFAGNALEPGMMPHAACYGGHQFGSWAGQLGDGRAISLGETRGSDGQLWELQLKGAGPTPYSRRADGRAVLRSSLREFLCSEAMAHLGVPTTRALCLVETGERVVRDMFYDGRAEEEAGAIVCRVAPTFLRFGNYELFASRGDVDTLRRLVAFTVRHFFPDLAPAPLAADEHLAIVTPEVVAGLLERVARSTARMIVEWMRVGFVHGVMNTDNMSILGLTIDYGPYGFLDDFDPGWTPNTTDASGRRYRYGNQPRVGEWNLSRLASALAVLVDDVAPLERALISYQDELAQGQARMMAAKLGLSALELTFGEAGAPSDRRLVDDLFDLLQATEIDMTIFYRQLLDLPVDERSARPASEPDARSAEELRAPFEPAFYDLAGSFGPSEQGRHFALRLDDWLRRYAARCLLERASGHDDGERCARLRSANPRFIPRNYLAQLAIDRATDGDPSELITLLEVLRRPYDDQPALGSYGEKRPEWARHRAGCSMLSCSS